MPHGRPMRHLLAAVLVLAAGIVSAAGDPPPLRIVTSFAVRSMNPATEGYWMQEFGAAELLMKFRRDGEHHPWLLSALENVDTHTWRLTVRDGVTFQNGRKLDAEAVLAAIEYQRTHSAAARSAVPAGARFTATGEYEITVTTNDPWPALPAVLADEAVFPIFDARTVEAADGDWASLVGAGIYTGPYEVVGLDAQALTLERYPDYWRGKPALPGVGVRFVTDPTARILAVRNDEADIALYPPMAARPMVEAAPGVHFNHGTPGTGGFTAYMNVEQAPLRDVRVRKALMKAIDYEQIAQAVFGGLLDTATGLYAPFFPWAVENYETDRSEANALLEAAGWHRTGQWRRKGGQALALTVLTYPQQPDLVPLANALQAQLRHVGIRLEIRSVDDIYAGVGEGGVDWDLALLSGGTAGWGNAGAFLRRYLRPNGHRNFGGYDNARINRLTDELSATVDEARRHEILREVQHILVHEDPYVFPLVFSRGRVVVNDRYRDYQPGFALFHVGWHTQPSGHAR